jgi:hypothetical protein
VAQIQRIYGSDALQVRGAVEDGQVWMGLSITSADRYVMLDREKAEQLVQACSKFLQSVTRPQTLPPQDPTQQSVECLEMLVETTAFAAPIQSVP